MERRRLCFLYAWGLTMSMECFEITYEWMSCCWLCSRGCGAGFWNQWLESLQDHCYLCGILLPGSFYDSQGTVVSASTGLGLDWNGHHWSMFHILTFNTLELEFWMQDVFGCEVAVEVGYEWAQLAWFDLWLYVWVILNSFVCEHFPRYTENNSVSLGTSFLS